MSKNNQNFTDFETQAYEETKIKERSNNLNHIDVGLLSHISESKNEQSESKSKHSRYPSSIADSDASQSIYEETKELLTAHLSQSRSIDKIKQRLKEINLKSHLKIFNDSFRLYWDLFIILLAIYNCFAIPIQVSFEPPEMDNTYITVLNHIIDFLFAVDIFVMFRTTYIDSDTGEEMFNSKRIAINYYELNI